MDTFLKSSQRVAEVPDAQGLATASLSVVATGVENPPTEVSSSAPLHEKNYPTSPQQNIPLNNTDFISSTIPSTSLNDEAQPTLFRNIANEQPQVTSELPSSLPSTKPLISENISPLDKNLLEENTSQLTSNFPVEFSLPHNENEKIDLPSNLNNNQEQILTKASKVNSSSLQEDIKTTQSLSEVDIPNISVSLKQLPQDIDPDKFPYQVDNPNTTPLINLIQEQQSSQTSNYPSPEQKSTDKSYDPETIIVIEPDIISQTYRTEFDPDNFPSDNSLKHIPLSSTNNSPSLENTLGVDSSPTLPDVSVTKNYIGEQQEIDSSEPSKSLPSLPVQLTPKLPVIVDIDKFSTNSDNNEELVNSELESTVAPNISNVASNIISLQPDNNLENAINDSIENQPVLVPNEFVATPRVSNISPEIIESPVVNTTSPEIVETSKVSDISSEIIESPAINATPYEIGETPIINNIAPEIIESPVVSSRFSELVETPKVSDISSEIVEAPRVSATSTEIVETSKVSDISSEIVEKPRVSDVSTNVAQTSSIFRKIVENEEIVESELLDAIANSENSEISSFIDSSDNQNILEKPTFTQNRVSIPPEVEQDTTIENLPAPKGYATGGKVTDSRLENKPYIAPSDTVPAMLTPGEFVINTRDAQKNLPLLHHINSGGTLEDVIAPSLQPPNAKEPGKLTSPHSTKVDSFSDNSLQLKPQESNSLIPSSLGLNVGKQQLSILNSPQISSVENKTPDAPINSPQYSSPPLIFRKANSTTQTSSQWSNAPSQWSSVEDLFNENDDDEFTSFFNSGESQNQNSEFSNVFTSSESPQMFAKQLPVTRGFADGGEVIAPENTELVTETIESTAAKDGENAKDDTADIEALAREIYSRLRQRLEIERERHGGYSGRLAW
ncbi:MAG: hypothetical protein RMX96_28410 [Nostoc sp. ChiSLP02]|nr:hypothetical protein [Nostoc sp. DedSLP05]MDZ8188761.1 hypothetical protein [Nostoc sp. ChiSLP02]